MSSMLAATMQNSRWRGVLFSEDLYWDYHHRLGHCLFFGVGMSTLLAAMSPRKALSFALYLAIFHLHLALDVAGSGTGWKIHYFWPVSDWGFKTAWAWELCSWQNISAVMILLGWTIWIAKAKRRTPLELLMPSLDRRWLTPARASEVV
jgi:hypothetical protein